MRTTDSDPFLALAGNEQIAWAMTRYGIFRIGVAEPRAEPPSGRAPKLLLSPTQLQGAIISHLGIGTPEDTRLFDRWYAKLLPRVSVDVSNSLEANDRLSRDGAIPLPYRYASASAASSGPHLSIWAHWDLSRIMFGSVTNPLFFMESNLRGIRDQLLADARWRYRECQDLVALLHHPPADPYVAMTWRMRLEEHAAYLAAMAGREIVSLEGMEAL